MISISLSLLSLSSVFFASVVLALYLSITVCRFSVSVFKIIALDIISLISVCVSAFIFVSRPASIHLVLCLTPSVAKGRTTFYVFYSPNTMFRLGHPYIHVWGWTLKTMDFSAEVAKLDFGVKPWHSICAVSGTPLSSIVDLKRRCRNSLNK